MPVNINRAQEGINHKSQSHTMATFAGSRTLAQLEKQATCVHDWQLDGQTMTAVRWTCAKCLKTELR